MRYLQIRYTSALYTSSICSARGIRFVLVVSVAVIPAKQATDAGSGCPKAYHGTRVSAWPPAGRAFRRTCMSLPEIARRGRGLVGPASSGRRPRAVAMRQGAPMRGPHPRVP